MARLAKSAFNFCVDCSSNRPPAQVIGVVKAYTTRVGEGHFPTELFDDDGATYRISVEEARDAPSRDDYVVRAKGSSEI